MAEERVGTGIKISKTAHEHLKAMAQADKRDPTTGEIEWLIEQEWDRRFCVRNEQPPAPQEIYPRPLPTAMIMVPALQGKRGKKELSEG